MRGAPSNRATGRGGQAIPEPPTHTHHPAAALGRCAACRHHEALTSAKGSTFHRCLRAETDARFRRYPPLPVLECTGFEPAAQPGEEDRCS